MEDCKDKKFNEWTKVAEFVQSEIAQVTVTFFGLQPVAWRGGGGGRTGQRLRASKVVGIKRVKLQKLHFSKLLKIYDFSYRKSTNTCCMDLIGSCFGAWCGMVWND